MFSGIVEEFATVTRIEREQGNLHLTLSYLIHMSTPISIL